MTPGEVRARVLEEHAELRRLLTEVDELARRVARGVEKAVPGLRERALLLHARLRSHLDLEDAILAPALRAADAWGPERADRLAREHLEQRLLLDYILGGLQDAGRPSALLARELRALVEVLREDMEDEEERLLTPRVLRDDVLALEGEPE